MRMWNRAWSYLQMFAVVATLADLALLLVAPSIGLFVTWYVLIPIVPITLIVAPGVWRNLCPVAVISQVPTAIGRASQRRLPLTARSGATIVSSLLLLAIVPLRPSIFNVDATALAIFTASVAVVALASGFAFRGKSGWCSSLCPVYPVERLYGHRPLIETEHAHCAACDGCVSACYDLEPTASVERLTRGDARSRLSGPYAVFAMSFPGFVIGYFTIDASEPVPTAYLSVIMYAAASLLFFAALASLAPTRSTNLVYRVAGAVAAGLYYWFSVPSIAEAATRLVGAGTVAPWILGAARAVFIVVLLVWLFRALPARPGNRPLVATAARSLTVLILALSAGSAAWAQDNRPGSTHLFITYRCDAAQRAQLLATVHATIRPRFDDWKRAGVMRSFELLFNTVVDDRTWDMMAVLRFEDFAQTNRWRALEQTMPGGLTESEMRIATPIHSDFADQRWQNVAAGVETSGSNYMVVIPYDWEDKASYTAYASVYVIPAFDRWIAHRAIRSYRIFYNMYPTGSPWDGLLLLEYRGVEGLAIRDSIKQLVRAELKDTPRFTEMGSSKREIRREGNVVVARDEALRTRPTPTDDVGSR